MGVTRTYYWIEGIRMNEIDKFDERHAEIKTGKEIDPVNIELIHET